MSFRLLDVVVEVVVIVVTVAEVDIATPVVVKFAIGVVVPRGYIDEN